MDEPVDWDAFLSEAFMGEAVPAAPSPPERQDEVEHGDEIPSAKRARKQTDRYNDAAANELAKKASSSSSTRPKSALEIYRSSSALHGSTAALVAEVQEREDMVRLLLQAGMEVDLDLYHMRAARLDELRAELGLPDPTPVPAVLTPARAVHAEAPAPTPAVPVHRALHALPLLDHFIPLFTRARVRVGGSGREERKSVHRSKEEVGGVGGAGQPLKGLPPLPSKRKRGEREGFGTAGTAASPTPLPFSALILGVAKGGHAAQASMRYLARTCQEARLFVSRTAGVPTDSLPAINVFPLLRPGSFSTPTLDGLARAGVGRLGAAHCSPPPALPALRAWALLAGIPYLGAGGGVGLMCPMPSPQYGAGALEASYSTRVWGGQPDVYHDVYAWWPSARARMYDVHTPGTCTYVGRCPLSIPIPVAGLAGQGCGVHAAFLAAASGKGGSNDHEPAPPLRPPPLPTPVDWVSALLLLGADLQGEGWTDSRMGQDVSSLLKDGLSEAHRTALLRPQCTPGEVRSPSVLSAAVSVACDAMSISLGAQGMTVSVKCMEEETAGGSAPAPYVLPSSSIVGLLVLALRLALDPLLSRVGTAANQSIDRGGGGPSLLSVHETALPAVLRLTATACDVLQLRASVEGGVRAHARGQEWLCPDPGRADPGHATGAAGWMRRVADSLIVWTLAETFGLPLWSDAHVHSHATSHMSGSETVPVSSPMRSVTVTGARAGADARLSRLKERGRESGLESGSAKEAGTEAGREKAFARAKRTASVTGTPERAGVVQAAGRSSTSTTEAGGACIGALIPLIVQGTAEEEDGFPSPLLVPVGSALCPLSTALCPLEFSAWLGRQGGAVIGAVVEIWGVDRGTSPMPALITSYVSPSPTPSSTVGAGQGHTLAWLDAIPTPHFAGSARGHTRSDAGYSQLLLSTHLARLPTLEAWLHRLRGGGRGGQTGPASARLNDDALLGQVMRNRMEGTRLARHLRGYLGPASSYPVYGPALPLLQAAVSVIEADPVAGRTYAWVGGMRVLLQVEEPDEAEQPEGESKYVARNRKSLIARALEGPDSASGQPAGEGNGGAGSVLSMEQALGDWMRVMAAHACGSTAHACGETVSGTPSTFLTSAAQAGVLVQLHHPSAAPAKLEAWSPSLSLAGGEALVRAMMEASQDAARGMAHSMGLRSRERGQEPAQGLRMAMGVGAAASGATPHRPTSTSLLRLGLSLAPETQPDGVGGGAGGLSALLPPPLRAWLAPSTPPAARHATPRLGCCSSLLRILDGAVTGGGGQAGLGCEEEAGAAAARVAGLHVRLHTSAVRVLHSSPSAAVVAGMPPEVVSWYQPASGSRSPLGCLTAILAHALPLAMLRAGEHRLEDREGDAARRLAAALLSARSQSEGGGRGKTSPPSRGSVRGGSLLQAPPSPSSLNSSSQASSSEGRHSLLTWPSPTASSIPDLMAHLPLVSPALPVGSQARHAALGTAAVVQHWQRVHALTDALAVALRMTSVCPPPTIRLTRSAGPGGIWRVVCRGKRLIGADIEEGDAEGDGAFKWTDATSYSAAGPSGPSHMLLCPDDGTLPTGLPVAFMLVGQAGGEAGIRMGRSRDASLPLHPMPPSVRPPPDWRAALCAGPPASAQAAEGTGFLDAWADSVAGRHTQMPSSAAWGRKVGALRSWVKA